MVVCENACFLTVKKDEIDNILMKAGLASRAAEYMLEHFTAGFTGTDYRSKFAFQCHSCSISLL